MCVGGGCCQGGGGFLARKSEALSASLLAPPHSRRSVWGVFLCVCPCLWLWGSGRLATFEATGIVDKPELADGLDLLPFAERDRTREFLAWPWAGRSTSRLQPYLNPRKVFPPPQPIANPTRPTTNMDTHTPLCSKSIQQVFVFR